MLINSNYPGGNIKILDINNNIVTLEQDLSNCSQWWFYWNFCVEAPPCGEVIFKFYNGDVVGPWGPAISFDRINWNWVGKDSRISPSSFKYIFDGTERRVYFSFSFPYQVDDFKRFYMNLSHSGLIKKEVLTISEKGRQIPLLLIGKPEAEKHIFLTCRHHACESVASYVLEGFIEYILSRECCLLGNCRFHIVPFMDIDGVEEGEQGKGRPPHDHNRDYIENPVCRSVSALMHYAKEVRPEIFIDLHCPWKWGDGNNIAEQRNNHVFFTKRLSPIKEEVEKLGSILADITSSNDGNSNVRFDPAYNISLGEDWFQPAPTSSEFFDKLGAKISCTCEFSYFGTNDMVITQKNSILFGKNLAEALEIYI